MPRKTLIHDLEMLQKLAVKQKQIVAREYKLTVGALDSWLTRIRKRRKDAQWYMNNILNLEKRNERMKKILLSAKIPERMLFEDEEDEKEKEKW